MRFQFASEHVQLASSVGAFLDKQSSPAAMRALWSTGAGRDPQVWSGLVEIGLPAMLVPETSDGLGGTVLDLCLALEEIGRTCVPDAIVESCVVAPSAIALCDDETVRAQWLPRIADGTVRATAGLVNALVPDAHVSDIVVLASGGGLRLLERGDREDVPVPSMDPSRRLFRVVAHRPGTLLSLDPRQLEEVVARQHVASAAVLIGLAQGLLDRTLDYVRVRYQFGRAIGSFQGVKHRLAEVASLLGLARIAVQAATSRLVDKHPGSIDGARFARICAGDAERETNRVALQLHGGIGFTWEHDLQLWLKRGKAMEQADGGYLRLLETAGARAVAALSGGDAGM